MAELPSGSEPLSAAHPRVAVDFGHARDELTKRRTESGSRPPHDPSTSDPTAAPAAATPPPAAPDEPARGAHRHLLGRVVFLIAFLLILQYFVPYLLERYQYAVTRGRQRAQHELALASLKTGPLDELSRACELISQQLAPSVVHLDVRTVADKPLPEEFAQRFGKQLPESSGQGSGVLVDRQGYIVTNFHVVHAASQIQVTLNDGRTLPAQTVGFDSLTDLAVLRIDTTDLVAAEWGDSEALEPGALVWAMGSPFGLQRTLTFGIISGKHRSAVMGDVYQDFLQTDAAVNPGNSGGPLVDVRGRVVGITTAIVGKEHRGVSFAIPSSVARQVYERLRAQGQVARGWLGVQLRDLDDDDVQRLKLDSRHGALVVRVIDEPGVPRPAKQAGLRTGDVIASWGGHRVTSPAELIRLVGMTEVGRSVPVVVVRNGAEVPLQVAVALRPKSADL
jgi:serine protease Do